METLEYTHEVKSRKEHRCNFCNGAIRKNEKYNKSTHVLDGDIYDWKSHKHCYYLAEKLKMYDECEYYGVTMDDFMQSISEEHFTLLTSRFAQNEMQMYSDIVQQLRHVNIIDKVFFVYRHYKKLEKQNESSK